MDALELPVAAVTAAQLKPIQTKDALSAARIALASAIGALTYAEGPGIARARSDIEQARVILKMIWESQLP